MRVRSYGDTVEQPDRPLIGGTIVAALILCDLFYYPGTVLY
jgi:hypothetical protein